ncbi:MAG: hypothetical protein J6U92_05535 [Clostridia bacterium]|nr:hypothetical protein [Clostridia bacterium]
MAEYVKCPRCDLNYMLKGEEYCDVCKAELKKGPTLIFAIDDDDDGELLEICPVCHQRNIKPGESMCSRCAEEKEYLESREDLDDESWKEYLDDDDDEEEEDEEMLSLNKLAEEEGEFDDEEEEDEEIESSNDDDDFDVVEVDESDFEEDEDDEEEKDEDDDYED